MFTSGLRGFVYTKKIGKSGIEYLKWHKFIIFAILNTKSCGCGVIGSRTRLRIWRFTAWGFESLHPHTKPLLTGGFFSWIDRVFSRS